VDSGFDGGAGSTEEDVPGPAPYAAALMVELSARGAPDERWEVTP
jgi:hypothetical protein